MFKFRELKLDDIDWVGKRLLAANLMGCEYCFGNNFIWQKYSDFKIAEYKGFYVTITIKGDAVSFAFPIGSGDIKSVIDDMILYSQQNGYAFHFHSLDVSHKLLLESMYNCFVFTELRDKFDYIYAVDDLADLPGKKYHGKRNHIKRFYDNNWSYEAITPQNIPECIKMNEEWCRRNNCRDDQSKSDESCVVRKGLENFAALNFLGGLLRVDGKVVAFTVAEKLNDTTVVVHIEKAFAEIQGAYPAINNEFVKSIRDSYKYVNREEDLGVEGLRKAKLSYKPEILLPKYEATI